jgi:hypothetical protein
MLIPVAFYSRADRGGRARADSPQPQFPFRDLRAMLVPVAFYSRGDRGSRASNLAQASGSNYISAVLE